MCVCCVSLLFFCFWCGFLGGGLCFVLCVFVMCVCSLCPGVFNCFFGLVAFGFFNGFPLRCVLHDPLLRSFRSLRPVVISECVCLLLCAVTAMFLCVLLFVLFVFVFCVCCCV